jgi:hypothetical protein
MAFLISVVVNCWWLVVGGWWLVVGGWWRILTAPPRRYFSTPDHSILRISFTCSQAKWLACEPLDLARRAQRAIFIVAEKHRR